MNDTIKTKQIKARALANREFVIRLSNMRAEAMALGLHITSRALHSAVQAVGWEIAGDLTKASEAAKSDGDRR